MIRKLLPFALGGAWGFFVFLVGLRLFFPSGAALARLQYELQERSGGTWQLVAESASPWRGTGLSLRGVELLKLDKKARARRGEEEEGAAPAAKRVLVAERLAARVRLLPLLLGDLSAGVAAELFGGELDGTVTLDGGTVRTAAELEDIDVAGLPLDGETLDLDLEGALGATWDLALDREDLSKSTGELQLSVEGLTLNAASFAGVDFAQKGSFPKALLRLELDGGKALVKEGVIEGDLLEATIDGDITLNKSFERWRLRIKVKFKLEDELDAMVKILPGPKDARRDDGYYYYQVSGTLLHPSFRAERERHTSARRRASPGDEVGAGGPGLPGPAMLPGAGLRDEEFGSQDPDERRRLREDRIRERRERLRQRREEAQAAHADRRGDPEGGEAGDEGGEDELMRELQEPPPDELPLPPEGFPEDVELQDAPFGEELLEDFGEEL